LDKIFDTKIGNIETNRAEMTEKHRTM